MVADLYFAQSTFATQSLILPPAQKKRRKKHRSVHNTVHGRLLIGMQPYLVPVIASSRTLIAVLTTSTGTLRDQHLNTLFSGNTPREARSHHVSRCKSCGLQCTACARRTCRRRQGQNANDKKCRWVRQKRGPGFLDSFLIKLPCCLVQSVD